MINLRYAVSHDKTDWFPIEFRPECERTMFDPRTGKDESLFDLIQRASRNGYDISNAPPHKEGT